MKTVMDKRQDLQAARKDIQKELMMPRYQVALGYILHNNAVSFEEYEKTLHQQRLKVKLKNAIMQVWTDHKRVLQPDMKHLIDEMHRKQKAKQKLLGLGGADENQEELDEEQQVEEDAKRSWINRGQFDKLTKRLGDAETRVNDQTVMTTAIDAGLERAINYARAKRRGGASGRSGRSGRSAAAKSNSQKSRAVSKQ